MELTQTKLQICCVLLAPVISDFYVRFTNIFSAVLQKWSNYEFSFSYSEKLRISQTMETSHLLRWTFWILPFVPSFCLITSLVKLVTPWGWENLSGGTPQPAPGDLIRQEWFSLSIVWLTNSLSCHIGSKIYCKYFKVANWCVKKNALSTQLPTVETN